MKSVSSYTLTVAIGLLLAPVVAAVEPGPATEPSRDALEARVSGYYQTFERRDRFVCSWSFFSLAMRRDNPIGPYLSTIENRFDGLKLIKVTKIDLSVDEAKNKVGKITAEISVRARGEVEIRALHVTHWVWQEFTDATKPDWYLAGEESLKATAMSSAVGYRTDELLSLLRASRPPN